jgi:hypothetical protein
MGVRLTAQRHLVDSGDKSLVDALIPLVADTSVDELGLNPGALHALWTLHGLGAIQPSNPAVLRTAIAALRHPAAAVRRAAIMVLPPSAASVTAVVQSKLLKDADAQVRLAALLALADGPSSDLAAKEIFEALQDSANSEDRWIPDAATAAAAHQRLRLPAHGPRPVPAGHQHSHRRSGGTAERHRQSVLRDRQRRPPRRLATHHPHRPRRVSPSADIGRTGEPAP